jgi:hypothetical protein
MMLLPAQWMADGKPRLCPVASVGALPAACLWGTARRVPQEGSGLGRRSALPGESETSPQLPDSES